MSRRPPPWLLYSVLSACFWGAWGFQSKVVSMRGDLELPPSLNHVLSTAGLFLVLPFFFLGRKGPASGGRGAVRATSIALLSGILGSTGNVLYYRALGVGMASVVSPLTALYPVVTIALAMTFLAERISAAQLAGMALSLGAIFLLSQERAPEGAAVTLSILEESWLWLSLGALLLWGVTGALEKLSTNLQSPRRAYLCFTAGYAVTALFLLSTSGPSLDLLTTGKTIFGLTGGVLNGLGVLCLFAALARGGKASVVVPLTALYPILTLFLAVLILGEDPTDRQKLGAAAAVAAGMLLSVEKRHENQGQPPISISGISGST